MLPRIRFRERHFTSIRSLMLFPAVWLLCGLNLQAGDPLEKWQSIELVKSGDLSVRLRVKSSASLVDEEWIAIEFENRGTADIELTNASYRLNVTRLNLQTGELVSSGGMASGNDYDLFPHAWKTTPVSPRIVKPGVYRMIDHPSVYSSAVLGCPPKGGMLMKSEAFVNIRIDNEPARSGSRKFEFQWLYPDEAGIDRLRTRLKSLLTNPRDFVQHAYLLNALLQIPDVAQVISVEELITAIAPRTGSFTGREYVLRHLNEHYATDETVIAYLYKRLISSDKRIVTDLRYFSDIRRPEFLPPLIERFERDTTIANDVFAILRASGTPQQQDAKLARRLSAALHPEIWTKPGDTGDQEQLAAAMSRRLTLMGQTHDREMIPRLIPYLDVTAQSVDPQRLSNLFIRLPPLRVCDHALEAILTMLDGSPAAAYQQAGIKREKDFRITPARIDSITKLRDRMIVTLRTRLAGLAIERTEKTGGMR